MALPNGPYDPIKEELEILNYWLEKNFYKPEFDPKQGRVVDTGEMKKDGRESFAIINPPPNAYARPHIGNVSGYAYQDVFGRFNRMNGKKVLMLPGKDHAGQEGEATFIKNILKPEGKKKSDYSRDEFYKLCYEFFQKNMEVALGDEKRVGLSSDFDRNIFTLDPKITHTVLDTFISMYNDGMIYKGVRIINWSPGMGSAISDNDTAREEREAEMVYINYPLDNEPDNIALEIKNKFENQTIEWSFERSKTKDGTKNLPFHFGSYIGYSINGENIKVIGLGYEEDKKEGDTLSGKVIGIQLNLSSLYRLVVLNENSEIDFKKKLQEIFDFELPYYAGPHILLFDEHKNESDYVNGIFVATTRPETMLADTAVVVDPTDDRYKDLIGKYVKLPLVDRKIPIIANGKVDKAFGTGAVKLTPAHSQDDYYMMLDWNNLQTQLELEPNAKGEVRTDALGYVSNINGWKEIRNSIGEVSFINSIWKDLKMHGPIGKYEGLSISEVREKVLEDLKSAGLIEKIEKVKQNVTLCDRTKTVVEPMMSSQWFVDVNKNDLFEKVADAIELGISDSENKNAVRIHPVNMAQKALYWLRNLRDWPISRSIWWGYRIPVWYKGEVSEYVDSNGQIRQSIGGVEVKDMEEALDKGLIKIQIENPNINIQTQKENGKLEIENKTTDGLPSTIDQQWIQDPDCLDTWFSSGQWPFATLTAHNLKDTFYPTSIMETSYDILEVWVLRMIMFGIYKEGKIPFRDVYLHGMIRGADGQKMSKSKGNVLNIDEVVNSYGADTLRLFYTVGNKAGAGYKVDWEKIKGYKNFLNKFWNASRFVLMNIEGTKDEIKMPNPRLEKEEFNAELEKLKNDLKFESNKKLVSELGKIYKDTTRLIDGFNIGIAIQELLTHFWHVFCDICIEEAKPHIYTIKDKETGEIKSQPEENEKEETKKVLLTAIKLYMKMFHPFIPFITERLWKEVPKTEGDFESLMYTKW